MDKYFSKIDLNHWTPKNKLQAEAHLIAKKHERLLIEDPENFSKLLTSEIKRINCLFPKCKSLELYREKHNGDVTFYLSGVFQLTLYKVKNA